MNWVELQIWQKQGLIWILPGLAGEKCNRPKKTPFFKILIFCQLQGQLVPGRREHNHPAEPEVYAAKQARARLREGLEETGGSVAEAVHQVRTSLQASKLVHKLQPTDWWG